MSPTNSCQPPTAKPQSPEAENRRDFLRSGTALAVAGVAGITAANSSPQAVALTASPDAQAATPSETKRPRIGAIGVGGRGRGITQNAMEFGELVAICDVDSRHSDNMLEIAAKKRPGKELVQQDVYVNYQKLLERDDVDVVVIGTPDHWHAKIAIEAMRAGKDVYCEKPLTLTIDEGNQIIFALEQTGRVFQVGTQQRSEFNQRFLTAVALCRESRLGKIQKITCSIGGAPASDSIPIAEVPAELDWDRWLGPAPLVDYRFQPVDKGQPPTRGHHEFRWWYEYSGGKLTDWGAHHVDIAQWALGREDSGPVRVTPIRAVHPVPLDDQGRPTDASRYNTATEFAVRCEYDDGAELEILSGGRNGLLIEGDAGKIFVSRNDLTGSPVDQLKTNPLPEGTLKKLYKGKTPSGGNAHMRNFFACVTTREQPISDVYSHHRSMTVCHLANLAIRLGREIRWNPETQLIVDDPQAQSMQSRAYREGYEVDA